MQKSTHFDTAAMCQFTNLKGVIVANWKWMNNFMPILLGMWLLIHAGIKGNP